MSKQRALELCGRAAKHCDDHALGSAILYAVEAIRALAKEDLSVHVRVASYLKERNPNWAMSYCEAMDDDLLNIVTSPRPVSDPPSPT